MAPARLAFALVAVSLIVLPTSVALAAPLKEAGDQIVLSGTVVVPRGEEVGEVVVLHGSARIDGVALGDVVVLDGNIAIGGQVSGSVVAVDGSVTLGPNARIRGDVTARGEVRAAAGATVDGRVRRHAAFTWRTPVSVVGRFATWLAVTVSTFLLGLGVVLLIPRAADAAFAAARESPGSTVGWGVGLAVLMPVITLLAMASLVALPLGVAVLLALALIALIGYVLAAYSLGRLLWGAPRSRLVALVIGWAALRAIGAIPFVSGVTFGLASVSGVGAVAVATWRIRGGDGKHREGRFVELPEHVHEEAGL
jgi:cytoskeletal protein CcmA (bactofilin family)